MSIPLAQLGARIRALRIKRGMTQQGLAQKADLSTVYLKKLESGERSSPALPTLARIARALDASLEIDLIERRRKGRA